MMRKKMILITVKLILMLNGKDLRRRLRKLGAKSSQLPKNMEVDYGTRLETSSEKELELLKTSEVLLDV